MILQLLQDECRATRIVPDRGVLIYCDHILYWLYCSLFLILAPRRLFFTLLFPPSFPSACPFFSHLALLSSDTLNQGVIDNVSASLSTSVNSLTLVCFSSPPPFCNVSSSARGHFVTPIPPLHYRQNVYTRYTPDVLIPEKMKSQDNPCKTSFFFFSPSSLRYLRLYTQHRSKDSFLSAHCVRAFFLCHSWTLHLPENMQWRHGNHQNSQTENHIFVPFLISGYMYMKTWV